MLLLLSGCYLTTPCADPCTRLYDQSECSIQRAGRTGTDLHDSCISECQEARQSRGDVGDYDPYTRSDGSTSVSLENRAQQELWAECIAETSCDDLADGFCAPVW